jgi:hypothetical protein
MSAAADSIDRGEFFAFEAMNAFRAVSAALVFLPLCCAAETLPPVPSPDAKFVFESSDPEPEAGFTEVRVRSAKTGAVVWKSAEQAMASHWLGTVRCLWSPDSRRFALNYQAGGRYELSEVYRWNGQSFVEAPGLSGLVNERLEAAKKQDLRGLVARLPGTVTEETKNAIREGSYENRIWDNCSARRWLDDNTLEVTGYSTRIVLAPGMDTEGEYLGAAKRFVVQMDNKGQLELAQEKDIAMEEAEKQTP